MRCRQLRKHRQSRLDFRELNPPEPFHPKRERGQDCCLLLAQTRHRDWNIEGLGSEVQTRHGPRLAVDPTFLKAKDTLGGTELLGRGFGLTCDSTRGGMQEPAQVDADAEGKDVELQR